MVNIHMRLRRALSESRGRRPMAERRRDQRRSFRERKWKLQSVIDEIPRKISTNDVDDLCRSMGRPVSTDGCLIVWRKGVFSVDMMAQMAQMTIVKNDGHKDAWDFEAILRYYYDSKKGYWVFRSSDGTEVGRIE